MSESLPVQTQTPLWVAHVRLPEGDPMLNRPDHESLPHQHTYWMDWGSYYDIDFFSKNSWYDSVIGWLESNCLGEWEIAAATVSSQTDFDIRIYLWMSFDDADDAVRARLVWGDLRKKQAWPY